MLLCLHNSKNKNQNLNFLLKSGNENIQTRSRSISNETIHPFQHHKLIRLANEINKEDKIQDNQKEEYSDAIPFRIIQNNCYLKEKNPLKSVSEQQLCTEYIRDIVYNLKKLEISINHPLEKHEITPSLRARMVDWIIEVTSNYKCNEQTFFLSVLLIDRYLKEKKEKVIVSEFHLIGVTSMFISSKFEDVIPLSMQLIHEKISHRKLTSEQVRITEYSILSTLNFFVQCPTSYEFLKIYLKSILNDIIEEEFIRKM